MTVMVPLVYSPASDTGFPATSVPCPVADQFAFTVGENVQLNVTDAPAASLATLAGVQVVQPVPVTYTFVIVELPVFFSFTVTVTAVPAAIVVPGLTVFVVRLVEAV